MVSWAIEMSLEAVELMVLYSFQNQAFELKTGDINNAQRHVIITLFTDNHDRVYKEYLFNDYL